MRTAPFFHFVASLVIGATTLCELRATVFIAEFDATNNGTATDVDGNTPDWIELRNSGATTVNLNGWGLSNDPATPGKWTFPNVGIAANQSLVVFASKKDRSVPGVQLHTNFRLGETGSIVLSQPADGGFATVHSITNYPKQRPGVTYGFASSSLSGALGYFETPTPNAVNSASVVTQFVGDTKFDFKRGFYDAPFTVTITTSTPGATIAYTTDGSEPTATNGTQVPPASLSTPGRAEVSINGTQVVRARGLKVGMGRTNVDTQTYIFPAQVLAQTGPPAGLTSLPWSHFGTADWAMDQSVVNHSNPNIKAVADDLKSIPTVSVVMDWKDLFGGATAIYPPASGVAREGVDRRASMELINPDGSKAAPNARDGFSAEGNVHIFGGTSPNRWNTDKLSFNFSFWQDVEFAIFGSAATKRFDKVILDGRYNNVWTYGGGSSPAAQRARSDYYGDALVADLHRLAGGTAVHTRVMHLYLNGIYWGIYSVHERPDEHFTSDYLGGEEEEWDVLKHNTSADNLVAGKRINPAEALSATNHTAGVNYQQLLNLAAADLSITANYEALSAKLDIDDFINYLLMNYYFGNTDWAHQNWYASYNRVQPDGKWRYHVWDAEHVMEDATHNVSTKNDTTGPTGVHQRLKANAEYRLRFADLAHRHLFNNGLLTNPRIWTIFDGKMQTFAEALRAESARWGDNRQVPALTRANWDLQRSWWRNTYFPTRSSLTNISGSVLWQLRNQSVYPAVSAPSFSQHGGSVPADFQLAMTHSNASSILYYTTDGTDPRVPITNEVSGSAAPYTQAVPITSSRTVKARVRSTTGVWSALNEAVFLVNAVPAAAGNLVISKIHYRPAPATAAEAAAGYTRSDFEFVEVLNISAQPVDLQGVTFGSGVTIRPLVNGVRELAPGGRALYVANVGAFELRYGTGLPIAGEFTLGSSLGNEGERLTLLAADGSEIVNFSYEITAPWPTSPDGTGRSLVLVHPHSSSPSVGWNWRESTAANGGPGVDDRLRYTAWRASHFANEPPNSEIGAPLADPDQDGLQNITEYFFGTLPSVATSPSALLNISSIPIVTGDVLESFPTISFRFVKAAEEVNFVAETRKQGEAWTPEPLVLFGTPIRHLDGTESRTYRSTEPIRPDDQRFFRLRLNLQ